MTVIIKKEGFKWSSLLGFEQLIAPYLIKLIYWLGVLLIVVAGVVACFSRGGAGGGVGAVLLAIGGTLVSLLLWRLISELWILAFSIFQRLGEIRDLLAGQNGVAEEKQ